jgi:hypothetical protein
MMRLTCVGKYFHFGRVVHQVGGAQMYSMHSAVRITTKETRDSLSLLK